MRAELVDMKDAYGDAAPHGNRGRSSSSTDIEDLIQREDMVVHGDQQRLHQARTAFDVQGATPRR